MSDLRDLFEQGTSSVSSRDLLPGVAREVRRRRKRQTVFVAIASTAAAVTIIAGSVAVLDHRDDTMRPVRDPIVTSTAPPTAPGTDSATQPLWDPFTITDAPRATTVLPERIDPPASAPSIEDEALPDIVLAWPEENADLRLLGSNGQWRTVPGTAAAIEGSLNDVVRPAISPDASRVAMSTDAGILVVSASGDSSTIAWPPALLGPFDTRPDLLWRSDDQGFVVLHWQRPWLMDLDGEASPAPFGVGRYAAGVMVDPDDGTVRERRFKDGDLVRWSGDTPQDRVGFQGYGERFTTRYGLVAYTGNPNEGGLRSGPVVLDAATGKMLAYAPIKDRDSVYSDNAHLTVLGFIDEDTVLLLVTPMDFRTMKPEDGVTHLVAWHYRTGQFERLTEGGPGMRSTAVAPDVLR